LILQFFRTRRSPQKALKDAKRKLWTTQTIRVVLKALLKVISQVEL
jgi:hypothetical protein